jgi:hypothetical protein
MTKRADQYQDTIAVAHWYALQARILHGMQQHLTIAASGAFAMYCPKSDTSRLVEGWSWVNYGPIAAATGVPFGRAVRVALLSCIDVRLVIANGLCRDWKRIGLGNCLGGLPGRLAAPDGDLSMVGPSCGPSPQVPVPHCKECAANSSQMFGESYVYERYLQGQWYFADIGNVEQASWRLYGTHLVRTAVERTHEHKHHNAQHPVALSSAVKELIESERIIGCVIHPSTWPMQKPRSCRSERRVVSGHLASTNTVV